MLAYVCPWLGRLSPWYLGTTVGVSATLGVDRKLVRDWFGKWSSWYLCTFVGVSARSALGVGLGKWSSWYAGTTVGVSARSALGDDLKLVRAWLGTLISWYLGTSVDVTARSVLDVDLQQHRALWVLLVLLRYNIQSRIKAPMRIKFMTSNTEKPAIHDVGDVADCLVVSLWSLSGSHCFPVLQPNEQLPLNLLHASLMQFTLHGCSQFSPKDWTHSFVQL